jgi:YD repeat-containing protein
MRTENRYFDADQRLITRAIADSRWTTDYDALGNVTKETAPDPDDSMAWGTTYSNAHTLARPYVTYAYDANQNRISTTNELGYTTNDTFDNLNQLIEEQAPAPSGSGSRPTAMQIDGRVQHECGPPGSDKTFWRSLATCRISVCTRRAALSWNHVSLVQCFPCPNRPRRGRLEQAEPRSRAPQCGPRRRGGLTLPFLPFLRRRTRDSGASPWDARRMESDEV